RGDPRPALRGLAGHGALDVRAFHFAFRGHDHARVVLELDHHALRPAERSALAHDDGVHHLLARLRRAFLDRDDQEVRDARARDSVADAAVLHDLDDLDDLRARVVDSFDASHLRQYARLSSLEALNMVHA